MMVGIVCLVLLSMLTIGHSLVMPLNSGNGHGNVMDIAQLSMEVANLKSDLQKLKDQRAQNVMFTVHMKNNTFSVPANNLPIIFDNVISNVGQGYNPHTGVFHTPVSGNYLLILQIMAPTGTDMEFNILYEGKTQTRLFVNEDDHSDMRTVTTLLHLTKGEEVNVVRSFGAGKTELRGGQWSQFSGTLLKAD